MDHRDLGRGRIASLDGIRAVSIVFVVLGHAASTTTSPTTQFLLSTFGNAGVGVSAFFVLSGYLITALLLAETQRKGAISLPGFYWRRAFRILPPFATLLLALVALRVAHAVSFQNSELIAAALFIWNYAPWTVSWWLGHTWSLSVEEQFYLCWPGVLKSLGRIRARRMALILIGISPFVRVAMFMLFPALRGRISIMAHTRVDTLMFGCWLALAGADVGVGTVRRSVRVALPYVAIAILGLHTVCAKHFTGRYLLTVGFTIEGAALTAIVHSVLSEPTSLITRALSLGPVAWLGRLSYSLYLWQQLFLTPLNQTWFGRWPQNLIAATTVAAVSYYLVEQPAQKLGRRLRGARIVTAT